jgi:hypothetical protein
MKSAFICLVCDVIKATLGGMALHLANTHQLQGVEDKHYKPVTVDENYHVIAEKDPPPTP